MPKGVVKSGKGTLVGNAGEFFVVGELLRRGFTAAPAPRNSPDVDVLAIGGGRFFRIRVKSKSAPSTVWQFMEKRADRALFRNVGSRDDFAVFVDLKSPGEQPSYIVIPTMEVDRFLKEKRRKWIETPGRGGRPHNAESRHHALDEKKHAGFLKPYREKWSLMGVP